MTAIRVASRRPSRLIEWPQVASPEWRKGFLAGIFDAEGSHRDGILRIPNTDPEMLAWLDSSLRALSFTVAVEHSSSHHGKPLTYYRITGGLPETLRFFLPPTRRSPGNVPSRARLSRAPPSCG